MKTLTTTILALLSLLSSHAFANTIVIANGDLVKSGREGILGEFRGTVSRASEISKTEIVIYVRDAASNRELGILYSGNHFMMGKALATELGNQVDILIQMNNYVGYALVSDNQE